MGILECVRWWTSSEARAKNQESRAWMMKLKPSLLSTNYFLLHPMKDKIASIVRHLLTGASAWAVNSEWLSATDADTAVKAVATVVAIVVSRLIIYGAEKIEWSGVKDFFDQGGNMIMVIITLGTALACGGLVSCSTLSGIPVKGVISYHDMDSGAKGGLVFEPEKTPKGFVRYPLRDPDTGEITGWADIEAGGRLRVEAQK